MIQSEVPKTRIDHFFKEDLLFPASDEDRQSKISFKSGHTLYKQTAKMVQDPPWLSGEVQSPATRRYLLGKNRVLFDSRYLVVHAHFDEQCLKLQITVALSELSSTECAEAVGVDGYPGTYPCNVILESS